LQLDPAQQEPAIGPPRPPQLPRAPIDEPVIGPPRPLAARSGPVAAKEPPPRFNAPASAEHSFEYEAPRLPVSNEVILKGHFKVVSALDVDRAGARVVTGGMDYRVCLYDFNGMKADGRPFRELMPHDGHPVHAVSFSPSGEAFICVTGEPRAKVRSGAPRAS
jgi:WD repeat-containing protein 70